MSKRNDRREAERLARRNAYLQSRTQAAAEQAPIAAAREFIQSKPQECPLSQAQLNARQANAQLSTGPRTETGKAISSKNALKHGLTGKTVLLPTDDATVYQRLLETYSERYNPATEEEMALVQSLLDSTWRIERIKTLETGIHLKGQIEFAKLHEDRPPAQRAQLIQVETYLKYEKSIRNLNVQEARLHRRMEKDQAELTRLQTIRKRDERLAAESRPSHPHTNYAVLPALGFEFSTPESDAPLPTFALAESLEEVHQTAAV